ncbi:MAG: endonuclease NucS [Myxococcota bacterium]|nr:endonuclease NucS [Myxococcota bacterium]
MSLETGFWRIGDGGTPTRIQPTAIDYEKRLEEILQQDCSIVSEPRKWLVIGRQVPTDHGGFIDLLALDESGTVIILELKRDRTDREVVSQVLDYASWVQDLEYEDIASIYAAYQERWQSGSTEALQDAFKDYFGVAIPEEVNTSHEMVIVATDLHPESERVVRYLQRNYGTPINAVFFSFFQDGGAEYLSRSWLVEPTADEGAVTRPGRWNGEFYAIFGYPQDVVEAGLKYGFLLAGGGDWYWRSMDMLNVGDRVWMNLGAGKGFGAVGIVTQTRTAVDDFTVERGGVAIPVTQAVPSPEVRRIADDPDGGTYAVGLRWLHTVPYNHGVWEKGFLANQNTVARPTSPKWDYTVGRLKTLWGIAE